MTTITNDIIPNPKTMVPYCSSKYCVRALVVKVSFSRTDLTSWFVCTHWCSWFRKNSFDQVKIRNQKFCYIQVIVFDLGYLPLASVETYQVRYYENLWNTSKDEEPLHFFITDLYNIWILKVDNIYSSRNKQNGSWFFLCFSQFLMVAYLISPNWCQG